MQTYLFFVFVVIFSVTTSASFKSSSSSNWRGAVGKPAKFNSPKPIKSGTYVIENQFTGAKYVGRSTNIQKRIEQHNKGVGSKWTAQSGDGWKLVKTYKGNNIATENAITRGVMRNEGIAHVRGGSYCKSFYPREEFRAIKNAHGFTNNGSS